MRTLLLLAFLLFCLTQSYGFAAKPEPPARLALLFSVVVEIENAISVQDWPLATRKGADVGELLEQLAPALHSTASEDYARHLRRVGAQLQAAVGQRDPLLAGQRLLAMQKEIFHSMEFFDYSVHPAFIVIQEYVEEAIVATDVRDYRRILHEMREIANILHSSGREMAQKGVGEGLQSDFLRLLKEVETAAEQRNLARLKSELKRMDVLAGAFVWIAMRQQ